MKANWLAHKRLLIVDDEPDVLETLEDLLPMCELVTATSFEDAHKGASWARNVKIYSTKPKKPIANAG